MTSSQTVKFTTLRGVCKAEDLKEWTPQLVDNYVKNGITLPHIHYRLSPCPSLRRESCGYIRHSHWKLVAPYFYWLNHIELLCSSFKNYVQKSLREKMTVMSAANSNCVALTEMRMQAVEQTAQTSITKAAATSNL